MWTYGDGNKMFFPSTHIKMYIRMLRDPKQASVPQLFAFVSRRREREREKWKMNTSVR